MATGSGLLALAVASAMGAPGAGDEPISCQVRVLTMDGLGWRAAYYPRMTPVARQGTSAVWTADRALAETLTRDAIAATVAPRCVNAGESRVELRTQTCYVSHVERVADGPIDRASAIAFKPETAQVEEGFQATMTGRKLDQGVLARVWVAEAHVKTMHTVKLAESYVQPDPCPKSSPACASTREILAGFLDAVEEKTVGKPDPRLHVEFQVPELSQAKVEGEWLIPNGGILLVSLGVETVAGEGGKAAVRERVAVLEVAPAPAGPLLTAVAPPRPIPVPLLSMPRVPSRSNPEAVDPSGRVVDLPPLPEALASADLDRIKPEPNRPSPQSPHAIPASADAQVGKASLEAPQTFCQSPSAIFSRLPMPPLPPRSFPQGMSPDGQAVDLPPLPEGLASADLDRIKPEPNQPSGQARHVAADTIRDPQLARTGLETAPRAEMTLPSGKYLRDDVEYLAPAPAASKARAPATGQAETIRIPIGGRISLEIRASLVPASPAMYKEKGKDGEPAARP